MEGLLEKKKTTGFFKGGWQKRFFRLENWTLLYFEIGPKSKDTIALRSDHAKGLIDLRDTECVRSVPEQPLCFQLKCAQRTYDLKAPTAADQSAWMSVLQVFQNYAQTIQSNRGTRPTMAVPDVYANALLRCIDHLEAYGSQSPGVFRLGASATQINVLVVHLLKGGALEKQIDVDLVACTCKRLLRELPETLLTDRLFTSFTSVPSPDDTPHGERPARPKGCVMVQKLVRDLPPSNRLLLKRLTDLVFRICRNHKETQMDLKNLSICLGPSFARRQHNELVPIEPMLSCLVVDRDIIFMNGSRAVDTTQPDSCALPSLDVRASMSGSPADTKQNDVSVEEVANPSTLCRAWQGAACSPDGSSPTQKAVEAATGLRVEVPSECTPVAPIDPSCLSSAVSTPVSNCDSKKEDAAETTVQKSSTHLRVPSRSVKSEKHGIDRSVFSEARQESTACSNGSNAYVNVDISELLSPAASDCSDFLSSAPLNNQDELEGPDGDTPEIMQAPSLQGMHVLPQLPPKPARIIINPGLRTSDSYSAAAESKPDSISTNELGAVAPTDCKDPLCIGEHATLDANVQLESASNRDPAEINFSQNPSFVPQTECFAASHLYNQGGDDSPLHTPRAKRFDDTDVGLKSQSCLTPVDPINRGCSIDTVTQQKSALVARPVSRTVQNVSDACRVLSEILQQILVAADPAVLAEPLDKAMTTAVVHNKGEQLRALTSLFESLQVTRLAIREKILRASCFLSDGVGAQDEHVPETNTPLTTLHGPGDPLLQSSIYVESL